MMYGRHGGVEILRPVQQRPQPAQRLFNMVTERVAKLCRNMVTEALKDDVGLQSLLNCVRSWAIEEAVILYGSQRMAARKLKVSRRVIDYHLRGK